MDTGMVSFVPAPLGAEWGLAPSELAWIVSTGFIGMALGAVFGGRLADHIGRRNVFAGTMLLYSAATGLCAFAWDLPSLLFFRFWVGFGLGGQLPVAVSLVSEYAPPKVRGRFIVLLESFWGLGWLAAALASYFFIPAYGWKSAFLIGALPLFYAFYAWKKLPESVPYLIGKGRVQEAHEIVCRLERKAGREPTARAVAAVPEVVESARFAQLWQPPFAKRTLMLWPVWFGIVFSYLRHFYLAAQAFGGTGLHGGQNVRICAGDDSGTAARLFRRRRAG